MLIAVLNADGSVLRDLFRAEWLATTPASQRAKRKGLMDNISPPSKPSKRIPARAAPKTPKAAKPLTIAPTALTTTVPAAAPSQSPATMAEKWDPEFHADLARRLSSSAMRFSAVSSR